MLPIKGEDKNMRKRTTTHQLKQVISNNLLQVARVEIYSKDSRETKEIDADTFKESLDFACESIFADCIGWHYTKDYKTGQYLVESGRIDGDTDIIVTVYLRVGEDVSGEDIEKVLLFYEEE